MKILVGTDSTAKKKLGGPGKFTPLLFKSLTETQNNKLKYVGFFDRKIVKTEEQIEYHEPINQPSESSSSIIRLIDKFPYLSVFLRENTKFLRKKNIAKITENILDEKIDLLHLHDFGLVSSLSNIDKPIIFTNHYKGSVYKESIQYQGGKNHSAWKKYFMNIEKNAIDRANLITFPSISAMNLLIEDFPTLEKNILDKHKIIYSGIDDKFSEIANINFADWQSKKENIILNIGNHIPDKGIENSLNVFKHLSELNDDFIFINVGAYGTETEKLNKLAQQLGLSNKVFFKGIVNHQDVMNYISKAKFILHTPNRVVFDLALLETMSSFTPIISSRALGNIEALGKEHNLYVDSENKFDFNLDLLKNERSLFDIAKEQRERFLNQFTTAKMVSDYTKLYEEFL